MQNNEQTRKILDVSFEFFPPQTEKSLDNLINNARQLEVVKPAFFSVTFGAGGGFQHTTQETVSLLRQKCETAMVPHISCVGSTKNTIRTLLDSYREMGVSALVVLRGDPPSGMPRLSGDFAYAKGLVSFIRQETGDYFDMMVAAYLEFHPESKTPQMDLYHLKQKIDAGAQKAITQYFFNADAYFYFRDDCEKIGMTAPIIPGIMPIHNWNKLQQFSQRCGAELPLWLCKRMSAFGDDTVSVKEYGIEVVTKLCEKLISGGVRELHFFSLNQSGLSLRICKNLGL